VTSSSIVRQGFRRLVNRHMKVQEQHVVAHIRAQSGECAEDLLAAQLIQVVDETGLVGRAEDRFGRSRRSPRRRHDSASEADNRPLPRRTRSAGA
jgi:hypothetical protein